MVWLTASVEKLIIWAIKPINNIDNTLIAFKINYRKKSVFLKSLSKHVALLIIKRVELIHYAIRQFGFVAFSNYVVIRGVTW